jgi:hypothetical protein
MQENSHRRESSHSAREVPSMSSKPKLSVPQKRGGWPLGKPGDSTYSRIRARRLVSPATRIHFQVLDIVTKVREFAKDNL